MKCGSCKLVGVSEREVGCCSTRFLLTGLLLGVGGLERSSSRVLRRRKEQKKPVPMAPRQSLARERRMFFRVSCRVAYVSHHPKPSRPNDILQWLDGLGTSFVRRHRERLIVRL